MKYIVVLALKIIVGTYEDILYIAMKRRHLSKIIIKVFCDSLPNKVPEKRRNVRSQRDLA